MSQKERTEQKRRPTVNLGDPGVGVIKALLTKVQLSPDGVPYRTQLLRDEHIRLAAEAALTNPTSIQLGSFVRNVGLSERDREAIIDEQLASIPPERFPYLDRLVHVIRTTRTIPEELSLASINPFTQFENHPPLLFGMGGGSKALCKGLPFDVLSMVLTAEKLRRELGLGTINILCANDITHTNIGKHPEFSVESIDRVMSAERDLLQIVVERLGLADHFRIFLGTDMDEVLGPELKEAYDAMVEHAKEVPFVKDLHYAMEIAEMYSIINQQLGGIKLGWFMGNPSTTEPKYIMDEQPFDARYVLYLASRGIINRVSIPYAKAGVRIYPDKNGHTEKAPPYIDYDPRKRILLSPFEDPERKITEATKANGGVHLKYFRGQIDSIVGLFEELVLGKRELDIPVRRGEEMVVNKIRRTVHIDDEIGEKQNLIQRIRQGNTRKLIYPEGSYERGRRTGERIKFILNYIFDGHRAEAERIWKSAFPVVK